MENYNRLVIDTFKHVISDYVKHGRVEDMREINNVLNRLNFELDRRAVDNLPTKEINALKSDVLGLKRDVL